MWIHSRTDSPNFSLKGFLPAPSMRILLLPFNFLLFTVFQYFLSSLAIPVIISDQLWTFFLRLYFHGSVPRNSIDKQIWIRTFNTAMFTTKFEFLKILKTKTSKMSRTAIVNFKMVYRIEFMCGISGRNLYKTNLTPILNEKLNCKKRQPRRSSKWQRAFSWCFQKRWNPCWSYTYLTFLVDWLLYERE